MLDIFVGLETSRTSRPRSKDVEERRHFLWIHTGSAKLIVNVFLDPPYDIIRRDVSLQFVRSNFWRFLCRGNVPDSLSADMRTGDNLSFLQGSCRRFRKRANLHYRWFNIPMTTATLPHATGTVYSAFVSHPV